MNSLRRTCAAMILSLALAVSGFAGQIDSPGAKPPSGTSSSGIATTVILTLVSLIR